VQRKGRVNLNRQRTHSNSPRGLDGEKIPAHGYFAAPGE
jgi:hypothetical protein